MQSCKETLLACLPVRLFSPPPLNASVPSDSSTVSVPFSRFHVFPSAAPHLRSIFTSSRLWLTAHGSKLIAGFYT